MDRPGLPSIFLSTLALGKVPSRPSRACVDSENTLHVFQRHINCNRVHARESNEAERYDMLVVQGGMKTWLFIEYVHTFCLDCLQIHLLEKCYDTHFCFEGYENNSDYEADV